MYCMNCGKDIPANVRFCSACGAPADTEATRISSRGATDARVRTSFDTEMATIKQVEPPLNARAPQTPRPPHNADEAERVIFSVRPTFLFIGIGYALAALTTIGLSILLGVFAGQFFSAPVAVLLTLPLLLIPAYKHLRRNAIKYTLTDSKIEIDQGLIARRTRNIPIRNIQDVTVSATIPQRIFGFGDLLIDNASELGGSTHLRNIPDPRRHADLLLRELRRWN
ncbi:MAG: PH domain-containing protein [Pyrinomonadaceae bacterium]